jgi:hypothetical protein
MNIEKKNELAQAVLDAVSACPEFKAAAKAYLDASDADKSEKAKALITEAKEDIALIDGTIDFFGTEMAVKIFGADVAARKLAHAKDIKANGAIYCDCPGCTAAKALIDNEKEFTE